MPVIHPEKLLQLFGIVVPVLHVPGGSGVHVPLLKLPAFACAIMSNLLMLPLLSITAIIATGRLIPLFSLRVTFAISLSVCDAASVS
ncbi:MAG: hypothetical protein COU68_00210 [Candidatus Pacebacteria bacterium CG10_big_fil_rev_8_21_14_0_10_45_6]|nr:MAG: hypothetical protein COU68_00210 [Candidatus Pacebacteria bacterium CG10_big_fil_rev_8_21_14_0_10_45_6]